MCVNNLPRVVTWKWNGQKSNPRNVDRKSNAITITPSRHKYTDNALNDTTMRAIAEDQNRQSSWYTVNEKIEKITIANAIDTN